MSDIYMPYKAVGYVTDGKPFVINRLGEETFITTSIGNAFQVYKFNKLQVCLVSQSIPDDETITCLEVCGQDTFVAIGSVISVFHRTSPVRKYNFHDKPIIGMLQIGRYLITYDAGHKITMIDTQKRTLVSEINILIDKSMNISDDIDVHITNIIHPSTYINKFVVSLSNGQLELWNFNSKKIIYKFRNHLKYLQDSVEDLEEVYEESEEDLLDMSHKKKTKCSIQYCITAMEQSPACDIIALGFNTGHILLFHLKQDEVLFSFKQNSSVTSLSFRTDAESAKYPCLASGCADGRVNIWCLGSGEGDDLSDEDICVKKLHCTIEEAHSCHCSKVAYMPGEPLLMTSSRDNSLKVWIFDTPDGTARLLRSREGHYGYPNKIRYYGGVTHVSMRDNADGNSCEILSCGSGSADNANGIGGDHSFRVFNTALEAQNREMSAKPILKKLGYLKRNQKLPAILDFDTCETRQKDWANVVTIHQNHANVYLWKYKHRVISDIILRQPEWNPNNDNDIYSNHKHLSVPGNHASAVCMSSCGNFAIVGTKNGMIYKYNVQSGLPRGSYPITASASNAYLKDSVTQMRLKTPGNVLYEQRNLNNEAVITSKQTFTISETNTAVGSVHLLHSAPITGIFIDIANVVMVSCCMDGRVIFWDFNAHSVLHSIIVTDDATKTKPVPLLRLIGYRDGNLVAIASQDRVIRVYDMTTYQLCRRFVGFAREITDMAFTPDGRKIIASSLDNTVRVWDVPTGRCLSWIVFDTPVLSLTMSLSGEYLCVSQLDREGISMYIDKSLYSTVHFYKEPTKPTPIASCHAKVDSDAQLETLLKKANTYHSDSESDSEEEAEEHDLGLAITPVLANVQKLDNEDDVVATKRDREAMACDGCDQRGTGTVTLSTVPRAYWTSLFYLEAIRSRNRPKEGVKAPPSAPFFLPTVNRNGNSAPSFPTPSEYRAIMTKDKTPGKKTDSVDTGKDSTYKRAKTNSTEAMIDDVAIMSELATKGSEWNDDDGEWSDGEEADDSTSAIRMEIDTAGDKKLLLDHAQRKLNASGSKLMSSIGNNKKKVVLPR